MAHLLATVLLLGPALQESPESILRKYQAERVAAIVQRVGDGSAPDLDRGGAYSELEHADFDTALRLAPSLLKEGPSLSFRAAWILAGTGDERGLRALRTMARDRSSPLTFPMQALGQLRDPESHEMLRRMLEDELARSGPAVSKSRISGLVESLAPYEDEADTDLVLRAVREHSPADWVSVDRLGRTGGSTAAPFLREVFTKTGRGWAVMSAGLALARCGDARGIRYVEAHLDTAEPTRDEERNLQDGMTDDPQGPKAKTHLLEHMGARRDEAFVTQLLTIATDPEQPFRARALGWAALLRIHSARFRKDVLEAAWGNASFEGAARLIVLDDEPGAREFVGRDADKFSREERLALDKIRGALFTPVWERRLWTRPYNPGF